MAYTIKGSWRDIYYHVLHAIDENNEISFGELYNNPSTQRLLREQFHNLGPDATKDRFKDMFKEIKHNQYRIDDDCEEQEVVSESLYHRLKKERKNEKIFENCVENILNRLK